VLGDPHFVRLMVVEAIAHDAGGSLWRNDAGSSQLFEVEQRAAGQRAAAQLWPAMPRGW
jgi:hypothetical protein